MLNIWNRTGSQVFPISSPELATKLCLIKLIINSEFYNGGIVARASVYLRRRGEDLGAWEYGRNAWKKLDDEKCLQVSQGGQAKNHTNSLPIAEHLRWVAPAWCILSAAEFQVPAMSFLLYNNQCQSKEQTRGRHGGIKGKLDTNPDPGAGPNEHWARNPPPGVAEAAGLEGSLAKKRSLEEFLVRALMFIKWLPPHPNSC